MFNKFYLVGFAEVIVEFAQECGGGDGQDIKGNLDFILDCPALSAQASAEYPISLPLTEEQFYIVTNTYSVHYPMTVMFPTLPKGEVEYDGDRVVMLGFVNPPCN